MCKLHFKPNILALMIFSSTYSSVALAQPVATESDQTASKVVELAQIEITAYQQEEGKKQNEITGLGKVHKKTAEINAAQILNLRDLVRYDPGISIVEQGRGASSGYAMRGVDKNRIGVFVDGIPQAQSYLMPSNAQGYALSGANGGAINEIEMENIRTVELSKGASSAEYGNGALGGAVGFRSKTADDILPEHKNWGIATKSAYTSKNKQWTNSVATATKTGGFEGLAIYTHRQGKEVQSHKAIRDLNFSYQPLTGYLDQWNLVTGNPNRSYFLIAEQCPSLDCTPSVMVEPNRINPRQLDTSNMTDAMRQQYAQENFPTMIASAQDYTGKDRISPDPMDYQSRSLFLKGAYQFSPTHRLEAVAERTQQRYDIRDMTEPAYYTKADLVADINPNRGVYEQNAPILTGLVHPHAPNYNYAYTRAKFFDELHKKQRIGLDYRYTPIQNNWFDELRLRFDHQKISLDSLMSKTQCSLYPVVDKHCRPSTQQAWAVYQNENNVFKEQHNLVQLQLEKNLQFKNSQHQLLFLTGWDRFRADLERRSRVGIHSTGGYEYISGRGTFNDPNIYRRKPIELKGGNYCKYDGNFGSSYENDCRTRTIDGQHLFVALRDHFNLGQYIDMGLGLRFDQYHFESHDELTNTGRYQNWSWNSGIKLKPLSYLDIAYRISNGFRVPAFYELYGIRNSVTQKNPHIAPEKSLNQEVGFTLHGKGFNLESSYFYNRYRDLISRATLDNQYTTSGFYNLQDVSLHGFSVLGRADWAPLLEKTPLRTQTWLTNLSQGLYSTFAYNHTQVKDRATKAGYTNTLNAPVLDAIQPARYVFGLGYDAPNEKWGLNWLITHSKAKRHDEVATTRQVGIFNQNIPAILTPSWYTHDLSGYANLGKYATVRAGIYNLFDYKYTTWEAVRQTSVNAVNQDRNLNGAKYAAAGRNFSLALELKF